MLAVPIGINMIMGHSETIIVVGPLGGVWLCHWLEQGETKSVPYVSFTPSYHHQMMEGFFHPLLASIRVWRNHPSQGEEITPSQGEEITPSDTFFLPPSNKRNNMHSCHTQLLMHTVNVNHAWGSPRWNQGILTECFSLRIPCMGRRTYCQISLYGQVDCQNHKSNLRPPGFTLTVTL